MGAAERDQEFADFVARSRPALWRTAYLLCGNAAQADDLVQEALLKLYLAWPRLGRETQLNAYTRRIVVNAHIDETRRPWRRETEPLDDHEPRGTDGSLTGGDESAALVRALRSLPPGQRSTVVLRHYWGLSVAETAEDLGVSQGTVKSQCAAGLRRLEHLLAPTFRSEERS